MNERSKTGFEILQIGVLFGVVVDTMLRVGPWGLNATVVVLFIVGAVVLLFKRHRPEYLNSHSAALLSAIAIVGVFYSWRDAEELKVLSTVAILIVLAVLLLPALRVKVDTAGLFHYVLAWFWAGFNVLFSPFVLIFDDIEWSNVSGSGWRRHLFGVLRGIAIAAPLVLIFGALFVAADATYEGLVQRTLNIDPAVLFEHAFVISLFSWFSAGYMRASITESFAEDVKSTFNEPTPASVVPSNESSEPTGGDDVPDPAQEPARPKKTWNWREPNSDVLSPSLTLGPVEIGVSLGLVNLLFLSFVIVQLPYLFGGFDLVQRTEDLKLSEYARRGFGELVVVAILVLPTLMLSHWLLKEAKSAFNLYRIMSGILIVLLFVIMASAMQRMLILTGSSGYGLSTGRFYPMVFIGWLAIVFVWLAVSIMRNARRQFAWGVLWSALFVLGLLHIVNPDDFIARTNVRLMNQGRPFDRGYNVGLSADAVPVILETFPGLATQDKSTDFVQNEVRNGLIRHYCELTGTTDFRTWNLSRTRALNAMKNDGEWSAIEVDCTGYRFRNGD